VNADLTPEQVDKAARAFARGLRTLYGLDGSTVEQAAQAALTPTGPSLDELIARITALRAQAAAA
jgi:hypothetical protein